MHKVVIFYTRLLTFVALFVFPVIYLRIYLSTTKRKTGDGTRILIIPQLTRIGDIVCSTPVFRAIKEEYPNSYISVLVSVNASAIIKNNPRIDEIIIIEDYRDNFFSLIKKIRESNFDWGISLSGTAMSSLLFFFGLIPNRMKITRRGRPVAEIFTDWVCNKKEKYTTLSYLPAFYLKMLKQLGVGYHDDKKEVFFNIGSQEKIESFFKQNGVSIKDKIVGVSITAGNKIKEWGDSKFEELCLEMKKRYGVKIVFIGSVYDKRRVEDVVKNLGDKDNFINGVGFSIEELPNLMSRFSFFIAVDTGPIHVAHALGIPLIDILGPVNDIELTPKGDGVNIVKSPLNIPPSVFAFEETLDYEIIRRSTDSITVTQVLESFDSLFRKSGLR